MSYPHQPFDRCRPAVGEVVEGRLPDGEPMDPEWEATERARIAASRWPVPADEVDPMLRSGWYREVESRNDRADRRHLERKACRRMIHEANPRHVEVIEAVDFDKGAPAIVAIEAWNKGPKSIAVLSGPTGTGKTTAAVYWQILAAGGVPRDVPMWIKAAEFARSSRYDDDRAKVLDARALVLDDLGVEFADTKGSFRTDLDELVDRFYSSKARLVITTNLDWKGFEERYGARVADRLAECGTWIPVLGASRRRKP